MKHIVSFCAGCGSQLCPRDEAIKPGQCDNCNYDVDPRENRCEGEFDEADYNRLMEAGQ